jgi:glycosyltransferase involved in cell wall biosynthesis
MYLMNNDQAAPLVSIIIPTHNRAYIIRNAVQSVLAQTYKHWEIIIIDDGSTDNTKEVLHEFTDIPLKYIYQNRQGPSAARNNAFAHVTGEWVAYIDSDNELYPQYLEKMIREIQKHKGVLYAFPKAKKTQELYKGGKLVDAINASDIYQETISIKDVFMREFIFDLNGFIHAKQLIDEGFKFDEQLHLMEDWDLLMRIADAHPDAFLYVPEELFLYRQRFGSDGLVSNASYALLAQTYSYIYQKHKSSSLMKGQQWYPAKVEKYQSLQQAYLQGKAPESYLRYFPKHNQ